MKMDLILINPHLTDSNLENLKNIIIFHLSAFYHYHVVVELMMIIISYDASSQLAFTVVCTVA